MEMIVIFLYFSYIVLRYRENQKLTTNSEKSSKLNPKGLRDYNAFHRIVKELIK